MSCLEFQHIKNFFVINRDNVFDLDDGLTYENIVNQQLLKKLVKTLGKQESRKKNQKKDDLIQLEKIFEKENFKKTLIHFPISISTECQSISKENRPLNDHEYPSKLLSLQMRLVSMKDANDTLVYTPIHKPEAPEAKLIDSNVDFIPLQVLIDYFGFTVQVLQGRRWYDVKNKNYPTINIVLYCFSGRKNIFKLFHRYTFDQVKREHKLGGAGLQELLKKVKSGFIDDTKSFRAGKYFSKNYRIELPYLLIGPPSTLESSDQKHEFIPKFKVSLKVIDICAIHGDASLAEIASNVGLSYEDDIKDEEKDDIASMYENNWGKFTKCAKGKCISHEIIVSYYNLIKEIYGELGLKDFLKVPILTIGATVRNLLESAIVAKVKEKIPNTEEKNIKSYLKLGSSRSLLAAGIIKNLKKEIAGVDEESIENFLQSPAAKKLKDKFIVDHEMRLLTKVIGGRTYCAQPLHISSKNLICDSDISGAYATALSYSKIPLGSWTSVPKMSFKEYLENHHLYAAEGLELIYVTVMEDEQSESISELPESQNFIPSFTAPKSFTEADSNEQGETRVYTHEIYQAPFTSSTFLWLDNIATKNLRNHIIDKGIVVAGGYYNTRKFKSLEDLDGNLDNLNKKEEWTAVDLKPMIDRLREMRKSNQKKDQEGWTHKSSAMNTLLKLMINNVYGVLSSSHFDVGNSIVANNVTGDVRLLAWCMETALGAFQTITDGVSWCLNKVVVGRDKNGSFQPLNSSHHLLHRTLSPTRTNRRDRHSKGWDLVAIGEAERYDWDGEDVLEYRPGESEAHRHDKSALIKYIDNELIHQHLKKYFPSEELAKFLDRFEIESKGLYTGIVTDGVANYVLVPPEPYQDTELVIKRRSHKIKQGEARKVFRQYYLEELALSPERVKIPMPYIDCYMVSCGSYRQRYESHFQYSTLIPGDYEPKVRSFHAFNLSQFTFRTQDQFQAKRKEHESAQKKCGLSTERYHRITTKGEVDDDHINYKEMLKHYEEAIYKKEHFYLKYQDYQNIKNYQRKYGSIQLEYPNKIRKEGLFRECREIFDYESSEVKQVPQGCSNHLEEEA